MKRGPLMFFAPIALAAGVLLLLTILGDNWS